MSQKKITVLCEDKQHAAFITRFLKKKRKEYYPPTPVGDGEYYVRKNYPNLLDAVRKKGGALIVMIDADSEGADRRMRRLEEACNAEGISPRKDNDPVALFIPARNIETWLAYLGDLKDVDENKTYDKLSRERECGRHVKKLAEMCEKNTLPGNAPSSLKDACKEWTRLP